MEVPQATSGHVRAWTLRASTLLLLLAPLALLLAALGLVFVYQNPGWLKWLWISLAICWALGFLLYRLASRHLGSPWRTDEAMRIQWTDHDHEAWRLVVAFADEHQQAAAARFLEPQLYWETTEQLAQTVARHYHPQAEDALESLTIPEILTAAELAISDVRRFVELNVPGSHLLTIRWLQRAPRLARFWNRVRPFYYAASLLWQPATFLARTATQESLVTPMMEAFKIDSMTGLYRTFVLQLGKYLIELNSHRLKVGPDRWRELMQAVPPSDHTRTGRSEPRPQPTEAPEDALPHSAMPPAPLQIVLAGQVKSGKSSLINALMGDQRAAVDVLPLTDTIQQYTLHRAGVEAPLILLDTVGYAHEGARADRVDETMQAVCQSAMVILVMNACEPAREPDRALLDSMEAWYREHPQRRRPPTLVVLTHVDRLSPQLEWSPPYDGWVHPHPTRPKERNIREAVTYIQELLGPRVAGIVPACTDGESGRVYGIDQWVVPAILNLLPQARAKHLLDVLYDQRDIGRLSRLTTQLWNAASTLAKQHFCGLDTVLSQPPQTRP